MKYKESSFFRNWEKGFFYSTPVMIPKDARLTEYLEFVEGKTNTFWSVDVGYPRDVELYPFYQIHNKRYSIYWDMFTAEEWAKAEKEYLIVREKMNILEQCTVDYVQPGEMQPERDHNFQGEVTSIGSLSNRGYRQASMNGWFSFDLKVRPQTAMMLVITYTGATEMPNCRFDVLVNGKEHKEWVEGIHETDKFYNVNFMIDEDLPAGNEYVTVTFKAHQGHRVRRVFGLRMVSQQQYEQLSL